MEEDQQATLLPHQVFISYAKEDINSAMAFYRMLKLEGIRAWIDVEALEPGTNWELGIRKALRTCRFVLVLISARSQNKKGYVQKEIREALDIAETFPDEAIYIIPVRLEDCRIPDRLSRWQCTDGFHEEGRRKVVGLLKSQLGISAFPLLKTQEQELRATLSAESLADLLLFRKFSFTEPAKPTIRTKEQADDLYISNQICLEVRKRSTKFIRRFDEVFPNCERSTVERLRQIVEASTDILKPDNVVVSVDISPIEGQWEHVSVLRTACGAKVGIDNDYLNYMRLKYPNCRIYAMAPGRPIVVEGGGKIKFLVMPFRLS